MARIRTIKPEFFRNAKLFRAEQEEGLPLRLAFAGLWTAADREGRFKWEPCELKLDCLPFDDVDFNMILEALAKYGYVVKYESESILYGVIPTWSNHQVINQREAQSRIPDPSNCTQVHVHAHAEYNEHVSSNITPAIRETILARDGGTCLRCGSKEDLTIDHIFPRSIGGNHALSNLRTLCRACNSARPVAGNGLILDLKKDGLTLNDLQRTCMHVQDMCMHVGKGREGKGREINIHAFELSPLMTNQEPQAVTAIAVRRKKSIELPEPLKPVYHAVVKAFEEVPESKALLYQDQATTGRELKAVKTMVTRCATLYPDDPGAFSKQIITSFFKLTHEKGKGSISSAFMPSQLMTNWIWYRAIEGLKDHVNEFDQNERIQAILDGRIKTDVVF